VRIEPRVPPPAVNFLEWDGLVRLVFNRKNKTLRAVLTSKTVLELLDRNYRTVASLKGTVSKSGVQFGGCVRGHSQPPSPVQAVPEGFSVQSTIEAVLEATGNVGKRGSRLDIDDFLALLEAMNTAGIHFAA
jgi:18S rRNA (adenine1779-N6/adenine1780-N6)-dimethyltransferase